MAHQKNENLSSTEVKDKIHQYLMQHLPKRIAASKAFTEHEKDTFIEIIKHDDYVVYPRMNGTPVWIVMIKLNDQYYAVNYAKRLNAAQDITLHALPIQFKSNLYCGTIMEGIYFRVQTKQIIVIEDVFWLHGETQLLKPKDTRMTYLSSQLGQSVKVNLNYTLHVAQHYKINKNGLINLYESIKCNNMIHSIVFCSRKYGKTSFTYTIENDDLKDDIIHMSTFTMIKTKKPDVFTLIHINGQKEGIAYIPTMQVSKMCRQWYDKNNCKELSVICQMDNTKRQWVPKQLAQK